MPIQTYRHLETKGELGIWEIDESETFFRDRITLTSKEEAQIQDIKGEGRRKEWLASRYLLHFMSGRSKRGAFVKDEFGKPHLLDSPFYVSISHSNHLAAVIATPKLCGIDIQKIVPKIERIAHKFMRQEELYSLQLGSRQEHLHVYWGAKEAIYKAYGRKELDFSKHILIDPFEYDLSNGSFKGRIKKGDFQQHFQLYYEQMGAFMLVYALEQKQNE